MDAAPLWQSYLDDGDPTARDQLVEEHLHLVYETGRKVVASSSRDVELRELLGPGTLGLMNAIDSFDPSRGLPFQEVASRCIRESILDDMREEAHEEKDSEEGPVDRRHVGLLRDAILNLDHEERLVVSLYYFQDLKLGEIAILMGLTESRVSRIRDDALQQLRDRLKEDGITGSSDESGGPRPSMLPPSLRDGSWPSRPDRQAPAASGSWSPPVPRPPSTPPPPCTGPNGRQSLHEYAHRHRSEEYLPSSPSEDL